jgi:hypothetical protein
MKVRVFVAIPVVLVLVACTQIESNQDEADKRVEALLNENRQLKEELETQRESSQTSASAKKPEIPQFDQKARCQKYIAAAKDLLDQEGLELMNGTWIQIWYFRSIFYSNSRNSCLLTAEEFTSVNGEPRIDTLHGLFDVMSGERLMNTHSKSEFDRQLKEYQ